MSRSLRRDAGSGKAEHRLVRCSPEIHIHLTITVSLYFQRHQIAITGRMDPPTHPGSVKHPVNSRLEHIAALVGPHVVMYLLSGYD